MHAVLALSDLLDVERLFPHFLLDFVEVPGQTMVLIPLFFLCLFYFFHLNVQQSGFLHSRLPVLTLSEHLLDHALVEFPFSLRVNKLLLKQQSLLLGLLKLVLTEFKLLAHLLAKVLGLF